MTLTQQGHSQSQQQQQQQQQHAPFSQVRQSHYYTSFDSPRPSDSCSMVSFNCFFFSPLPQGLSQHEFSLRSSSDLLSQDSTYQGERLNSQFAA